VKVVPDNYTDTCTECNICNFRMKSRSESSDVKKQNKLPSYGKKILIIYVCLMITMVDLV